MMRPDKLRFHFLPGFIGFLLVISAACSRPVSDDVAASVDGSKIYRAEVEKYYQNQTSGSDQQPAGEQATSLRLSILRELIDNEILMRRAEKLGLLATDEEVDRKLNEIKSPYTKEEFDARLKAKKITFDDFKPLAMNYSEDTETSGNGGDLGFTPESSLRNTDATTRDTVAKLRPGQYSPIISVINPMTKQLVGFRLVKLVAKEPAGQRELSDPRLRQAIRAQLQDRREQLLKAAYYEILRDQAKVENYYAQKVLDSNGAAH